MEIKNSRAQTFTIVTIILIGLLIVTTSIITINMSNPIKKRISTMDNFLFSLEENLQRQLFISGYRTTFLAIKHITDNGEYISNYNTFYNESFYQGTINGVSQEIMEGATYSDVISSIQERADKINVNINFTNAEYTISQEDPWNIKLTLHINISMEDKEGLASWNKEKTIVSYVPITEFEDPIYTVETNALISKKINRTIYEGDYVSGSNVSNLLNHVQNGFYTSNSDAPSFLKRIEGNFSPDDNGIESLVDISELSDQGIIPKSKSVIDHIYFSEDNPSSSQVSGMPGWFLIDSDHEAKYQVSGLTS